MNNIKGFFVLNNNQTQNVNVCFGVIRKSLQFFNHYYFFNEKNIFERRNVVLIHGSKGQFQLFLSPLDLSFFSFTDPCRQACWQPHH